MKVSLQLYVVQMLPVAILCLKINYFRIVFISAYLYSFSASFWGNLLKDIRTNLIGFALFCKRFYCVTPVCPGSLTHAACKSRDALGAAGVFLARKIGLLRDRLFFQF